MLILDNEEALLRRGRGESLEGENVIILVVAGGNTGKTILLRGAQAGMSQIVAVGSFHELKVKEEKECWNVIFSGKVH